MNAGRQLAATTGFFQRSQDAYFTVADFGAAMARTTAGSALALAAVYGWAVMGSHLTVSQALRSKRAGCANSARMLPMPEASGQNQSFRGDAIELKKNSPYCPASHRISHLHCIGGEGCVLCVPLFPIREVCVARRVGGNRGHRGHLDVVV